MAWMIAGAALLGAVVSSDASQSAAQTQANAANQSAATQQNMFNTINSQQAPWRQAGQNALDAIMYGQGLGPAPGSIAQAGQNNSGLTPGQFTHTFNSGDLNSNLAPNYQWQLGQGLGALQNSSTVSSGLVGGNTLKAINDYAQNFAGNSYQQAFNNYNAQQTNIFNRLSNIAGLGQTANQTTAVTGADLGKGIANSQQGAGQAIAAGLMGQSKALSGGLNNAASWYPLSSMLNQGGASGFGAGIDGSIQNDSGTLFSM